MIQAADLVASQKPIFAVKGKLPKLKIRLELGEISLESNLAVKGKLPKLNIPLELGEISVESNLTFKGTALPGVMRYLCLWF